MGEETIDINNEKFNKKQLYLKSIDLQPSANAYHNLAFDSGSSGNSCNETIELIDGSKLTRKQLYLKSIELEPNHFLAFNNLANLMTSNGLSVVTLLSGQKLTIRELYLKCIDIDCNFAKSYHNLANTIMDDNETVKLLNGTVINKRQLYLKSIDLQPNSTNNSYYSIASQLKPNETSVTLLNGKIMNEIDLYVKSIDVNPNSKSNSYSFNNLGNLLKRSNKNGKDGEGDTPSITLLDGRKLNKLQLYCKAISIDNNNIEAYYNLAVSMKPNESVIIDYGDGGDGGGSGNGAVTKKDLYIKLLELEPSFANTYYNLALNIKKNELVTSNSLNQKDLILKAIDLDPSQPLFYSFLYNLLSSLNQDSITLINGKIITINNLKLKLNINNNNDQTTTNNFVSTIKKFFKF